MYRNKQIRGIIESFYQDKLMRGSDSKNYLDFCSVHLIDIKETDENFLITIFAERPGILIGLRGSLVNELKGILVYHLLKVVEIDFKEFNPFKNEFKIN